MRFRYKIASKPLVKYSKMQITTMNWSFAKLRYLPTCACIVRIVDHEPWNASFLIITTMFRHFLIETLDFIPLPSEHKTFLNPNLCSKGQRCFWCGSWEKLDLRDLLCLFMRQSVNAVLVFRPRCLTSLQLQQLIWQIRREGVIEGDDKIENN